MDNFAIVNGEIVGEHLACYGIYEEELTEAFMRLVQPGSIAIDIGMHLGYYSTLFAHLVGAEGTVYAFEPTPSTRSIASINVGKFSNVRVLPYAVWSSSKEMEFRDYGLEWMAFNSFTDAKLEKSISAPNIVKVETISLDTFRQSLKSKVSILKIDAESAESEIIIGASALLKNDRPILSVEVGDLGGNAISRTVVEQLISAEFRAWEFTQGRFVPHSLRERYTAGNLIFAPSSDNLSAL